MTENEIYIQVRDIVKTQKIGSVELVGNNLVFTLEDKSKLYVNTTDNEVKITSIRTNKDGFLFVTLSTGLEFDAGRYSRIASKCIQLTIDSKVTKKSQNPVTSAAIYKYGQNLKADILDNLPDIDGEKEVIEGHYDFNEGKFYTDEKKTEEVTGEPSKLYISVTTDSEPTVIDKFEAYKVKVGEEFLFQVEHQYINLDDKEKIYNTYWNYYTLLQAPQEDAYMVVYEYMRDENRKQVDFAIGVLRTIDDEPCIYIDSGILQNTTWFHRQPYKSIDILPDGSRKDNDSEQTWNRNGVISDDFDIHSSSDVGELAQVNSEAIYTPNGIVIDRPLNENTGVVARNEVITTYEKNYTLYNYDEATKDFKQLGGGSGNLSDYYTKTEIDDKFKDIGTIIQEDVDELNRNLTENKNEISSIKSSIADVIPPSYVHSLFFGMKKLYLVSGAEAESFNFNYPSGHGIGGSATTFEYDSTEQSWKLDNNGGGTPHCQMVFWLVDVTDYSSATLVLKKVNGTVDFSERTFQIRSSASLGCNPKADITKYVTYEQTSTQQTLTLDLSDITGEQYIAISLGGTIDAYVEELYLE